MKLQQIITKIIDDMAIIQANLENNHSTDTLATLKSIHERLVTIFQTFKQDELTSYTSEFSKIIGDIDDIKKQIGQRKQELYCAKVKLGNAKKAIQSYNYHN